MGSCFHFRSDARECKNFFLSGGEARVIFFLLIYGAKALENEGLKFDVLGGLEDCGVVGKCFVFAVEGREDFGSLKAQLHELFTGRVGFFEVRDRCE